MQHNWGSDFQKEAIDCFCGATGAERAVAAQILKVYSYSLEAAVNAYLDENAETIEELSPEAAAVAELFDEYKEPGRDIMRAEGVVKLCEDLCVDPADVVMLIISYYFGAECACEYTRQEFETGMRKLGCTSINQLKEKLPYLREEIRAEAKFQEVYSYAYQFSREEGQKYVQLEVALAMWRLLFSQRPWPLLEQWCAFLSSRHRRPITRDTWLQLLEFTKVTRPDLSSFDDSAVSSAWPHLIDDFVAYLREDPKRLEGLP